MFRKIVTSLFLPLSLITTTTFAAPFDDGLTAFQNKDYETALEIWMPLAQEGHIVAQYNIGTIYDFGLGVAEDDVEGVRWYRMAAEQEHTKAQYNLAVAYDQGEGVEENDEEAVYWYRLAAKQGNSKAQHNLGVKYYYGRGGLQQNEVSAYVWISVSAEQGDETSQNTLRIVTNNLTDDQVATAQILAKECLDSDYQNCP